MLVAVVAGIMSTLIITVCLLVEPVAAELGLTTLVGTLNQLMG
jgi:hypothetical protein